MAHTDACKYQVCEFMKRLVDKGIPITKASVQTEKESDGIPAETVRRWWYEIQKETTEVFKNEQSNPTPQEHKEIQEIQDLEPKHGGPREGAGRPQKYEEDSDALFNLKRWWKKATKKDRSVFLNWIREEKKS
jgi:hypothetical protein